MRYIKLKEETFIITKAPFIYFPQQKRKKEKKKNDQKNVE